MLIVLPCCTSDSWLLYMAPRLVTPLSTCCRWLEEPSSRVLINSISHSCASDKHKHGIQLKRHGSLKPLKQRYPHFRICCEWRRFCWLASVTFSPKVPSSVYIPAGCQLNLTNHVKQTADEQTEGDWTQMWPCLHSCSGMMDGTFHQDSRPVPVFMWGCVLPNTRWR